MFILVKKRVGTIIALFKIIGNLFKMTGGKDDGRKLGLQGSLDGK